VALQCVDVKAQRPSEMLREALPETEKRILLDEEDVHLVEFLRSVEKLIFEFVGLTRIKTLELLKIVRNHPSMLIDHSIWECHFVSIIE
jgi:hypothetical protein